MNRFHPPQWHDGIRDDAMRSHRHSGASYHIPESQSFGPYILYGLAGFMMLVGLCVICAKAGA